MNGDRTIREILSQPEIWLTVLEDFARNPDGLPPVDLGGYAGIYFLGSGSSYYLGLTLASLLSRIYPGTCRAIPSCEVIMYPELYFDPDKNRRYLVFVISRSGKSTEALLAAERARMTCACDLVALTCHVDSPLVQKCDSALVASAAREDSVVMTRAFTSMLLLCGLSLLRRISSSGQGRGVASVSHNACAGSLESAPEPVPDESVSAAKKVRAAAITAESLLRSVPQDIEELLNERDWERFVFLGSGPFYGVARESALKLQEMAVSSCEAYHILEYRHGPKATIGRSSLVVLFVTPARGVPGVWWATSLAEELKQYGAGILTLGMSGLRSRVFGKTPQERRAVDQESPWASLRALSQVFVGIDLDNPDVADSRCYEASRHREALDLMMQEWLLCCLAMLPMHILGFSQAVRRSLDPDSPQHLSQVVELPQDDVHGSEPNLSRSRPVEAHDL